MSGYDLTTAQALARRSHKGILAGGCAVAQQGSPDMSVAVAAGTAAFGFGSPEIAIAAVTVAIAASDPDNDRIDLICVDGDGHVTAVTGVPAASPGVPSPDGKLVLAKIAVAADATDVETANITDERIQLGEVTSGSLPTITFTTATGAQVSTLRDAQLIVPLTFDPSSADATVAVALSPDGTTYTTVGTITCKNFTNAASGDIRLLELKVPAGWYVKLTATHATIGTGHYY